MLEREIESIVCKYAEQQGWLQYKFTSPSNRGVPDRLFLKNGKIIFIEFKAPGKKLTRLQNHIIKKIRLQGFTTEVIDDTTIGKSLFKRK
jgi:hypothetical protein